MDPQTIDEYVGNQLRLKRKELGLNQRELAEKVDVALRQLQKYEQGLNKIGAGMLYTFAGILGVKLSYFFEGLGDGANHTKNITSNIIANDAIVAKLVTMFISLPQQTQKNILKLVTDLSAQKKFIPDEAVY